MESNRNGSPAPDQADDPVTFSSPLHDGDENIPVIVGLVDIEDPIDVARNYATTWWRTLRSAMR